MRLPYAADPAGIDIGLIGVPWDGGTTNRAGARHGPREIRNQSSLIRRINPESGITPFQIARVADLGDSSVNPCDVMDTLGRVERFFRKVHDAGCVPLSAGGDHLITLPIFRAIARNRPVGMVHFDAHSDTWDKYFGESRYTHGTPFRRAVEEGLLDPKRTVQIGIRGSLYSPDDLAFAEQHGMRMIKIEEYFRLGVRAVIEEARRVVGDGPTYVSFDVDGLDPVFAPGTGTPEIGGFTTFQAQQMLRLLEGVNIAGADVVEVSPPFDPSGLTAYAGVVMMFEILCAMSRSVAERRSSVT
jgi:guanidinopropionase